MDNRNDFQGLRFDRQAGVTPWRLVVIGIALAIFTLFWFLLPTGAMYWLLLIALALLAWVATFGWRQALVSLIEFLRTLEDL